MWPFFWFPAFNRSGATRAMAVDISKAFDRFWHPVLLHKRKSYGISGQIIGLISSFLSNRQLWVVLDGNSSQEYSVNAGVSQGSILDPTLFLLYINDLPDDVICNIAICADNTTFYAKCIRHLICGNNLNWLLNWNLIYKALWTGVKSALLISMLGNLSWFCLTGLITMVLLMSKWMGLFLRKNNLLRCWSWPSLLNWIGVLTLSLLLKLPPRKLKL